MALYIFASQRFWVKSLSFSLHYSKRQPAIAFLLDNKIKANKFN